ncbi:phage tail length tape measure family protein [Pseudorhizobium endolithicum]|nr:phage tail length tape measure family protein [Pseudorhizobium endolithicum]
MASQAAQGSTAHASALNAEATAATKASGALRLHAQAANQNLAAVGRSSAMAQQNVRNLAFQFQDIGTMLASGQSPLVLLAQQLPQITMYGGQLTGVMTALKSTLAGLFSPLGILTTAFVLAGSAAISYFMSSKSTAEQADEAWKAHGEIIKSLKEAFGEAAEGLDTYVLKSHAELAAAARIGLSTLKAAAVEAREDFVDAFLPNGSLWGRLAIDEQFRPFQNALEQFRASAAAGTPDFIGLRNEVERLAAADPQGLRAAADEIINASSAAAEAERKVKAAEDAISLIGGTAAGQVGSVNQLTKALNELANIAVPALSDADRALDIYRNAIAASQGAEDRAAARAAYDAALGRIGNTAEGAARELGVSELPTPGRRPLVELEGLPKVRGGSRAKKSPGEKYEDIVANTNRRIASLQAEQQALGMTEEAAAALRYEQDLLNRAQQAGITLSPQQQSELSALAGSMASLEAATKAAKEQIQFVKDVSRGFVDDFVSGLANGEGAWKSFANAALNALSKIADKLLDSAFDGLFGGGGGGLGGIFRGLFGGGSQWSKAASGKITGLFASGGYTGNGAAHQAAGIVHGGEFVFSKKATDRIGVRNLDAMHKRAKGYASGGHVAPVIPANNNAGGSATGRAEGVHVTVGVAVDDQGGLQAYVKNVTRQAISQSEAKLPDRIANLQKRRAI